MSRIGNKPINVPAGVDNKTPLSVYCVSLREINAPKGVKKIDFCLLTTIKVETLEDALKIIHIYRLRWVIEEFHRVLENTCKIENLRNDTAERINRLIAFYIIIAWRIMLLLQLGRHNPTLPANIVLSQATLEILTVVGSQKYEETPDTIEESNNIIGKLGGFTGTEKGSRLGYEVYARGLEKLQIILEFYQMLLDFLPVKIANLVRDYVLHGELSVISQETRDYFQEFM